MKHEITTYATKAAMAASLKRLMNKKPLSKITVKELIDECGINRNTFYYHFTDIYALLKWMLEEEAVNVVRQFDLLLDYREAVTFVMDYIDQNSHILNCAYDSLGRDGLRAFLKQDFLDIMHSFIDEVERAMNVAADPAYKRFLTEFYTEALSGLIISQFREDRATEPTADRDTLLENLERTLAVTLPAALEANTRTLEP